MTSDERHPDFADIDTYDFVCANRACPRYDKAIEVAVVFGTSEAKDHRDLDCECGAVLIPVDVARVAEQVEDETIRRYSEVNA